MLEQDDLEVSPWLVGPLFSPYGQGMNLSIQCSDTKALAKALEDAGIELRSPIEECWYRAWRKFQVHVVRCISDRFWTPTPFVLGVSAGRFTPYTLEYRCEFT